MEPLRTMCSFIKDAIPEILTSGTYRLDIYASAARTPFAFALVVLQTWWLSSYCNASLRLDVPNAEGGGCNETMHALPTLPRRMLDWVGAW